MKAMKYFVVGAMLSISATSVAQEVNFNTALEPIAKAMKENPAAAEKLAKSYIGQFKKDPQALISLGSAYLSARNFDKANEIADMVIMKSKKDLAAQAEAYILKGDIEAVKDQSVLFGDDINRGVAIVYRPLVGTSLVPFTRVLAESGFTIVNDINICA